LEAARWREVELATEGGSVVADKGVVTLSSPGSGREGKGSDGSGGEKFLDAFEAALARHRHWDREVESVPADDPS